MGYGFCGCERFETAGNAIGLYRSALESGDRDVALAVACSMSLTASGVGDRRCTEFKGARVFTWDEGRELRVVLPVEDDGTALDERARAAKPVLRQAMCSCVLWRRHDGPASADLLVVRHGLDEVRTDWARHVCEMD